MVPAHYREQSRNEPTSLQNRESRQVDALASGLTPLSDEDLSQLFQTRSVSNRIRDHLLVDADGPLNCLEQLYANLHVQISYLISQMLDSLIKQHRDNVAEPIVANFLESYEYRF